MTNKEFLQWIHDRLVNTYGENPNYDYMHRLREIIDTDDETDWEIVKRKVVWYVETGFVDGNGIGKWEKTVESYPFPSEEAAIEFSAKLVREGHLSPTHFGELRPPWNYGAYRIRRAEEPIK